MTNPNIVSGKWDQLKRSVKERWGKLTDNDLAIIAGRRDQLVGILQERYGYAQEQAKKEVDSFYSEHSRDFK